MYNVVGDFMILLGEVVYLDKYGQDILIMIFPFLILEFFLIYKGASLHIKHVDYKKRNFTEYYATIKSFCGSRRNIVFRFLYDYVYSYNYVIDDKEYSGILLCTEDIHNKGDKIKILYDRDDFEESVSLEEYNKIMSHRFYIYYLLFLIVFALLVILLK